MNEKREYGQAIQKATGYASYGGRSYKKLGIVRSS